MVDVTAPISTFSGVVQCQTLIAAVVRHLTGLHARRREHLVTAFALRAPWYVRERARLRPARPAGAAAGASRCTTAPTSSSGCWPTRATRWPTATDDLWSYPVPVTPSLGATRPGPAGHPQLVTTDLRKLYQPSHDRFYAVVVEVFCDQPGLPRAGSHDDIEVGFVMRRQRHLGRPAPRGPTPAAGPQPARGARRPAAATLASAAPRRPRTCATCGGPTRPGAAVRARTTSELLEQRAHHQPDEGWFDRRPTARGGWTPVDDRSARTRTSRRSRCGGCPPRDGATATRRAPARPGSAWSRRTPREHYGHRPDDQGARRSRSSTTRRSTSCHCFVEAKPAKGHEHCPPQIWWGDAPSRAVPAGRADGPARAPASGSPRSRCPTCAGSPPAPASRQGPGGVRIVTPPQSQLVFNPFKGHPRRRGRARSAPAAASAPSPSSCSSSWRSSCS